jgi:hypothetical protein
MKLLILAVLFLLPARPTVVGAWTKLEGVGKTEMTLNADHTATGLYIPDINVPKDGITVWTNTWQTHGSDLCFYNDSQDVYTCYVYGLSLDGTKLHLAKAEYTREK